MTKKILFVITVALSFCAVNRAYGQYDPSFTHYWMVEPLYNPASSGSTDNMRIVGAYSAQMSGYEDAPKTMYAGVDLPMFFLNPRHGMGVFFMNDEIGLFSHKRVSLQYAFRFPLFSGLLGLGVQGDFLSESFDGSKVDLEDANDPAFATSKINGSKLDAAVGLYYQQKSWYFGVSTQHLTAPKVMLGEKNELDIKRAYYLTGGYNIKLRNPFLSIHPSVWGAYDGTDWKAYISGRVEYTNEDKQLFAGASYSPDKSVAAFIGGKFHGVVLSYSYEAYTSGIGFENGSHEIVLSYEWKLDLYKKGKNMHKSVRLL